MFLATNHVKKVTDLLLEEYCLVYADLTSIFCGREVVGEEIFGEHLAGNADSSQQTGIGG